MTYNIIGDVAGRYDELISLLSKMPKADKIILVGDIIDRGPKSKEVLYFAMTNPDIITIKGNHEEMAVKDPLLWVCNGGRETIKSLALDDYNLPEPYKKWINNLPIFFKDDGLFISHAPWSNDVELGEIIENVHIDDSVLWNRHPPKEREGIFQIFGHSSRLKQYGNYAICIDNSGLRELTGLHWPTKEIFKQEYLKKN